MKKRLRKKKHVGEFKEWGVPIVILIKGLKDFDIFFNEFMEQGIVKNHCSFGGGGQDKVIEGFIELGKTTDSPEDKIKKVKHWLDSHDNIEKYVIGEMIDAWYGPFDEMDSLRDKP